MIRPGIKIGISREQSKKYLRNRASCQIAARASSFYEPVAVFSVRRGPKSAYGAPGEGNVCVLLGIGVRQFGVLLPRSSRPI
jgi:hypothetical protein